MIQVVTVATPELGDRSYLLHDGEVAVAVDPQRDTERILAAAAAAGVRIVCVAETHIHNDYVSGGWALAQRLAVPYLVAAAEPVSFERRAVHDGDVVEVGRSFSLQVVATPGHTPHHVSYVALERGRPASVCTGGSMLFGSTGRTDLLGDGRAVSLARSQYRSVRRLGLLPGSVAVLPTHGFGSFCSPGAVATVTSSTIGRQRTVNAVFRAGDEETFVGMLLGEATAYPSYYRHMAARNLQGASPPDLTPPPTLRWTDAVEMAGTATWMVDLRARASFAQAHVDRSLNVEHGPLFTTYLGWLLPPGTPVVLLGESERTVAAAQLDLTRIGIDRLAGRYVGRLGAMAGPAPVRSYPVRGFAELAAAQRRPGNVALDVRRQEEWEAGHLDGAVHLPLHDLAAHVAELPEGTLWVHCAAGYRAAIAASLLERAGRRVVLIDDQFANAGRAA